MEKENGDIVVEVNPDEAAINEVRHLLQDYNEPYWEIRERNKYRIAIKENDCLSGGVVFTLFGEWLEIDYFCIHPNERAKGLGTKLLAEVEKYAISKGCKKAALNTFNFQAKPFYEKNGYEVKYVQKNYPKDNVKYFMEKEL